MTHIAEQVPTQHNKQVELAYNTFMFEMPPTQRSSGFFFLSQFCDAAILAIIHKRR
jgi:hypothetical protein